MPRTVAHTQLDAGILQHVPGFRVPEGFTPDAWNVDIAPDGKIWLPRPGAVRWLTSPLQTGKRIDGLWQLRRADGTWAILSACNGQLYSLSAGKAATAIGSAIGAPRRNWSAQVYGSKIYTLNGEEPRVYGTELEDFSDIEDMVLARTWRTGNWPRRVSLVNAGQNERLAMWGMPENPSYIYFSGLRDPLDWDWTADGSSALRLTVRENDGEAVVAVLDFGDLLLVMKETVTVAYRGLDYLDATAVAMKVLPFGCGGADSVVRWENGAAWWGRWDGGHGPMSIRSTDDALELRGEIMSQRIKDALQDVSDSQLHRISGHWRESRQAARWHVPSQRSTKSNLIFDHYPFRRYKDSSGKTLGAFHVGGGLDATCALTLANGLILGGDSDGYVNRLDFGRQDLGSDIKSFYSFPTTVSAGELRVTCADFITGEGGAQLRANVSWDDKAEQILAESLESNLGDERTSRHWPMGSGRRFRTIVEHKGGDVAAELEAAILDVDPMGVR